MFLSTLFTLILYSSSSIISAKPCETCQCGISSNTRIYDGSDQTRILGGKLSNPSDWPFVAQLEMGGGRCTGSIIGTRWILSAAHCNPNEGAVQVKINGKSYSSKRSIIHEEYNEDDRWGNDIMLVELSQPIQFSNNVSNVCLFRNLSASSGNLAAVIGYGYRFSRVTNITQTYLQGIPIKDIEFTDPNLLHETPVSLQEMDFCLAPESYNSNRVCAGGDMQGITQGDSGGPLLLVRNNRWIQYGISSNIIFSGVPGDTQKVGNLGIYAKVSAYCDWINAKTGGEVQCT